MFLVLFTLFVLQSFFVQAVYEDNVSYLDGVVLLQDEAKTFAKSLREEWATNWASQFEGSGNFANEYNNNTVLGWGM